jgi:hypothetical protein
MSEFEAWISGGPLNPPPEQQFVVDEAVLISDEIPYAYADFNKVAVTYFTKTVKVSDMVSLLGTGHNILERIGPFCRVTGSFEDHRVFTKKFKNELLLEALATQAHNATGAKTVLDAERMINRTMGYLRRRKMCWCDAQADMVQLMRSQTASKEALKYHIDRSAQVADLRALVAQHNINMSTFTPREIEAFSTFGPGLYGQFRASLVSWYPYIFVGAGLLGAYLVSTVRPLQAQHVLGAGLMGGAIGVSEKIRDYRSQGVSDRNEVHYFDSLSIPKVCIQSRGPVDYPKIRPGAKVTAHHSSVCCEDKPLDVYGGIVEGTNPIVPLGCSHNMEAALRIRKTFDRDYEPKLVTEIVDNFISHMKTRKQNSVKHLSYDAWLSKLPNHRRRRMLECVDGFSSKLKQYESTTFNKGEVYFGKTTLPTDRSPGFKPRVIDCRADEFQNTFGLFFSELGNMIKEDLHHSKSNLVYTSGMDAKELGHLAEVAALCYNYLLELDVSNFDGSIVREWYKLEKWYVEEYLPYDFPHKNDLLRHWSFNVGSGHGCFFRLQDGRRSGDGWTSCFNTVINLAIIFFIYGEDALSAALGDDNFAGVNKFMPVDHLVSFYKRIGMKLEAKYVSLDTLSFCSGFFYTLEDGSRKWGLNPFKIISKWGVNFKNHAPVMRNRLLKGTAISLLPIAGHVPVVGSFLRKFALPGKYVTPPNEWWKPTSTTVDAISSQSIYQLALICNVAPGTIVSLDCLMEILKTDKPFVLSSPDFLQCFGAFFEVNFDVPLRASHARPWTVVEEFVKATCPGGSLIWGCYESIISGSVVCLFYHTALSFLPIYGRLAIHLVTNELLATQNDYQFSTMTKQRKNRNQKPKQSKQQSRKNANSELKALQKALRPLIAQGLRTGGQMAGNYFAPGVGGVVGRAAGGAISHIAGFGDYSVTRNSLKSAPLFGKGRSEVRIRHREYVGDVSGSTDFEITKYVINPGNRILFPWLSGLAQGFQQYRLEGLVFYFNSTSATALNSTNTALGAVIGATNYDVNSPDYVDKADMLAAYFSNSCKPSEDMIHALECDPKLRPVDILNIDHQGEGNDDSILYDHGNFYLATYGMQAAAVIGELWVSYDIVLMKPQRATTMVDGYATFGSWNASAVFGGSRTIYGNNLSFPAHNKIDFTSWRGKYVQVTFTGTGTSLSISSSPNTSSSSGLTLVDVFEIGTAPTAVNYGSTGYTFTRFYYVSEDHESAPFLIFDPKYSSGTTTDGTVYVSEVHPSSVSLS